jgi:hypothetical protein
MRLKAAYQAVAALTGADRLPESDLAAEPLF